MVAEKLLQVIPCMTVLSPDHSSAQGSNRVLDKLLLKLKTIVSFSAVCPMYRHIVRTVLDHLFKLCIHASFIRSSLSSCPYDLCLNLGFREKLKTQFYPIQVLVSHHRSVLLVLGMPAKGRDYLLVVEHTLHLQKIMASVPRSISRKSLERHHPKLRMS